MDIGEQPADASRARLAPTFVANANDLIAYVAIGLSGIGLLCCATAGNIVYCLPVIGLILGIVGWIQASQAVNPEKAKTLSIISVASMAVVLAILVVAILAYVGFIILMVIISASSGSPG